MNGAARTEHQPRPPRPSRPRTARELARARRRRNHLLPLLGVGLIAFIAGAVDGSGSPQRDTATRFANAWAAQDFTAMHKELSSNSQAQYPLRDFAGAYITAQRTATATEVQPGPIQGPTDRNGQTIVSVDMRIPTRLFGVINGVLEIPFDGDQIAWAPKLTFPGLNPGERLGRHLMLSARAPILAKDGTPLASGQGAARTSPLGGAAIDIVGRVGLPNADLRGQLEQQGYPSDAAVGTSGLELAFNSRLLGTPGGQLLAVTRGSGGDTPAGTPGRVIATAQSRPGTPVRTTIDPKLQRAAVSGLSGQLGGVAVLSAKDGSVLALAGSAYSQPSPPGSTFKIITTSAALQDRVVKLSDSFPVVSSTNAGGRVISNANNEMCGGTFVQAFAKSCNTVFAPLGPKIGATSLVGMAEKYGFNQQPQIFNDQATKALNPPRPQIPTRISSSVDLAATAIGQGQVLTTPLQMASAAQTVAEGGIRSPTPITHDPGLGPSAKPVQVVSPQIAATLRTLMLDVVRFGTGTSAQITGIPVAGKTGTAELGPKPNQPPLPPAQPGQPPPQPKQILDAWFTCFAPASKPKVVVAVFLANASDQGGVVAAPIARSILGAAFGR